MPDRHLPKDTEKEAGGPERAGERPELLRLPRPGAVFSAEEAGWAPRETWTRPEVSVLSSENAQPPVRGKETGSRVLGPGRKSVSSENAWAAVRGKEKGSTAPLPGSAQRTADRRLPAQEFRTHSIFMVKTGTHAQSGVFLHATQISDT